MVKNHARNSGATNNRPNTALRPVALALSLASCSGGLLAAAPAAYAFYGRYTPASRSLRGPSDNVEPAYPAPHRALDDALTAAAPPNFELNLAPVPAALDAIGDWAEAQISVAAAERQRLLKMGLGLGGTLLLGGLAARRRRRGAPLLAANGRTQSANTQIGWKQLATIGLTASSVALPQLAAAQFCGSTPRVLFNVDNSASVTVADGQAWITAMESIADGIQAGTSQTVEFAAFWWDNAIYCYYPDCRYYSALANIVYYPANPIDATPDGWTTDINATNITKPNWAIGSDWAEVSLSYIRRNNILSAGNTLDLNGATPFMVFFSDSVGSVDSRLGTKPYGTDYLNAEHLQNYANPLVGVPTAPLISYSYPRAYGGGYYYPDAHFAEWAFLKQPQGYPNVTYRDGSAISVNKDYPAFRDIFAVRSAGASNALLDPAFDAITGAGNNFKNTDFNINQTIIDSVVASIQNDACVSGTDYGDAPQSFDGNAASAAAHTIGADLRMGNAPEADGATPFWSASADGDDLNDTNDEDGVDASSLNIIQGGGFNATLTVNSIVNNLPGDAQLVCWADFNQNNTFDTAERSQPGLATHTLAGGSCNTANVSDSTFTTGNVPAGCGGNATVLWSGLASVPTTGATIYSRCRLTTEDGSTPGAANFFSDASPSPIGPARDGETEDNTHTIQPTAATIGEVTLESESVSGFIAQLGAEDMDSEALRELLAKWAPEAAAAAGDDRDALISALAEYLDPNGDGQVALLRWDTLEERGTIGFYVERQGEGGEWELVSGDMLPGLINAPMGGEYFLVDPQARTGNTYLYRLIEQEATGNTRTYGPYTVRMQ